MLFSTTTGVIALVRLALVVAVVPALVWARGGRRDDLLGAVAAVYLGAEAMGGHLSGVDDGRLVAWVGVAHLHGPALGTALSVSFRPALRDQRVVGVLLSAIVAGEEGELLTTDAPALELAPALPPNRMVGLDAKSHRMILLSTEEIRFAEADGSDVWLDTDRGRLRAPDRGLGLLEERLRPQGFLRVHRHFLVNIRRVEEVAPSFQGCFWLVLDGPGHQLIPVSRRRIAEVRRHLGLSWSHHEEPGSA